MRDWFIEGSNYQTVATTGLNDGSSRGHTCFDIALNIRTMCVLRMLSASSA